MKNNVRGTSFRRPRVLIALALASTLLAGGSAALAGGDGGGDEAGVSAALAGADKKPVFVSGNSTASDCGLPGSDYALSLTGDLEGCWSGFIQGYKCKELADYDLWLEKGREVFVGEFHGKQGRFRTTYTFEAAYAKGVCESFDFTLEVGGGCRHKVIGGSGVFADAEGLIKYIDVIAGVTGDPDDRGIRSRHWGKQFPLLRPYRFRSSPVQHFFGRQFIVGQPATREP